MTVKELVEILEACNPDARVLVKTNHLENPIGIPLEDNQVFHMTEWELVVLDPTHIEPDEVQ
jgi:hypothetical protein